MIKVSILILTKNEQQDLPGCLQSVSWSDDIHVYDSGSIDDTVAIAQKFGGKVTARTYGETKLAFGGDEAAHRNWGLQNIPFKHSWVFVIDADERVTPALVDAIKESISAPENHVAFRIRRRDYLMGRWLKYVTPSPFNIRLFKPGFLRYERFTNPVTIVDGPIGEIEAHFDHFPFSKGMTHWLDKHNKYSTFEAEQIFANRINKRKYSLKLALFGADKNDRRFHQKELYYRLPLRPLLMFALLFVAKRGFLDGKAGLTFALLRSMYEYMIVLKVREMEALALQPQDRTPPSLDSR